MKIKSKKPSKQRKFLYDAPLHVRKGLVSAHLSKELRQQYKRRALPVRKGDEVQIVRGKYADKTGKISRVDLKEYKIYIEGVTRKRTVGTDVQVPMRPSNLKLINLNLDDKFRKKILQRKEGVKFEKEVKKETEVKNESKEAVGAPVLESAKESKEVGSKPQTRSAQKV